MHAVRYLGNGARRSPVAAEQRPPARSALPARVAGAARVEPDPGDIDIGVLGVRVDRDPLAGAAGAPQLELARVKRRGQQVGAVQRVGDGARAVVAVRDEAGVAAAVDVGLADQLVARRDRLPDPRRRVGGRLRKAVGEDPRASDGPARRSGRSRRPGRAGRAGRAGGPGRPGSRARLRRRSPDTGGLGPVGPSGPVGPVAPAGRASVVPPSGEGAGRPPCGAAGGLGRLER